MKKNLKILTLCYEYPPIGGGGAKVARFLVEGLTSAGWSIDLVTMGFGTLPRMEAQHRFRLFRLRCWRRNAGLCRIHEMLIFLARAVPRAIRLATRGQYAFVHTHFLFPDGVTALFLKWCCGKSYIVTVHGSDVPGYNPDRFKFSHRLLRPVWQAIVAHADLLVCPSTFIEELVRGHAPCANTRVIPNGIDTGRFVTHRQRRKRVLAVTRMFERKGVQYLLHALHGLDHDYEICVVGDGPYLDRLKKVAAELRLDVQFPGYIENSSPAFRDLFETSEIFVFTSAAENCPMVLLEAMCGGLAIITSDDTGCRETVGDAALVVRPEDPLAIRHALRRLMDQAELRMALGQAARRRVETCFASDIILKQYALLYAHYLSGAGAS